VIELTGVENPKSVQQLMAWLNEQGRTVTDLTKDTVGELLLVERGTTVGRVLELRQELALSASAKYDAAVNMSNSDGRFRGSARYYGAHTGRWAGRGIQLQNLPRASLGPLVPLALLDLMSGFGASPEALKALVRPLLLGPLTVVDFSAIEARVTAWLAGEEWMLEEFRGDGKIYERTAERMGIPDPYGKGRQSGKVASLALGFGGGIGALKRMGGEKLGTDDELQEIVDKWRHASPHIKRFWYELWKAFLSPDGGEVGRLTVHASKGVRRIELPSGRHIVYRGVKRVPVLSDNPRRKWAYVFTHPTGKITKLWHGTITENVVQGVARDLLAHKLPEIAAAGIPVVAHVHDEVIAEGDHLEELTSILTRNPAWADGLPIDADGDVKQRYAK
jgi:DNA polymerase